MVKRASPNPKPAKPADRTRGDEHPDKPEPATEPKPAATTPAPSVALLERKRSSVDHSQPGSLAGGGSRGTQG